MDFYSAYAQGFARIAAVTLPVHLADPVANAAAVIEQARACHDDSVAVASSVITDLEVRDAQSR